MSVVTISATYGARGNRIARAVADRLDLPFFDRAIPSAGAHELAAPDIAESLDEPAPTRWQRIAAGFAHAPTTAWGPDAIPMETLETPEQFRASMKAQLEEIAATTGAVMLGRAGMVVLGGRPDVLCARLDGPVEARIAQVVAEGVDEGQARQEQREIDRARNTYARVFYRARQDDHGLYHVMLDSTVLSSATCTDIIVRAALDRFGSPG
jgi:cytidylate kinase